MHGIDYNMVMYNSARTGVLSCMKLLDMQDDEERFLSFKMLWAGAFDTWPGPRVLKNTEFKKRLACRILQEDNQELIA